MLGAANGVLPARFLPSALPSCLWTNRSKGTDLLLFKSLSGGQGFSSLFDVQVLGLLERGDSGIFVFN